MTKRFACLFLSICLVFALIPAANAAQVPTQAQVYARILALEEDYPDGSFWGDDTTYKCVNTSYSAGGKGCVGFAYLVSEAAFGTELDLRKVTGDISIKTVRVGDILRNATNSHSVVVLEILDDSITVLEGNNRDCVRWGRTVTAEEVASSSYMLTRYPKDYVEPTEPSDPSGEPEATEPSEEPEATEPPAVDDGPSFPDIDDHWAEDEIELCIGLDLMKGMDTGLFAPEGTATRAQLVTILWRFSGEPEYTGENPFKDLTDDWYYDAVCWAAEEGIVTGMTPTTFDPDQKITREQLATILYRYHTLHLDQTAGEGADLSQFPDCDSVSDYAKEALAWACSEGIVNGVEGLAVEPVLLPLGSATRAQMAAMLVRYIAME